MEGKIMKKNTFTRLQKQEQPLVAAQRRFTNTSTKDICELFEWGKSHQNPIL